MDLALNNLQRLIFHKPQSINQPTNYLSIYIYIYIYKEREREKAKITFHAHFTENLYLVEQNYDHILKISMWTFLLQEPTTGEEEIYGFLQ